MTQRRLVALALGAAVIGAAAAAVWAAGNGRSAAGGGDLATRPQTVLNTIPFGVGDQYTMGMTAIPDDVPRPVRVTGIEVLHLAGLEVAGTGTFDKSEAGLGLVPGWPPGPVEIDGVTRTYVIEPVDPARLFEGDIGVVTGLRVTAPVSGFRGVRLSWVDGTGRAGSRTFDWAATTCPDVACQDPESTLRELGLMTAP